MFAGPYFLIGLNKTAAMPVEPWEDSNATANPANCFYRIRDHHDRTITDSPCSLRSSQIEAVNQKFGAAYNAHNAEAIAKLYTEQAIVFPPGQDMVKGREGIRKFWAGMIDSGIKFDSLDTVSVEKYDHTAREIGHFTLSIPHAGGPPTQASGKYVVVWKLVKGAWLLDSDIWNMNQ
jgi:uncharacterized protein (TIGR02246 family)